ncbi:hypothetical protein YDYSG_01550 [Paenibacillus tyrfis]|nr:hypothetical protein YDYSG_01550 [Paenibacillus tyrfis]
MDDGQIWLTPDSTAYQAVYDTVNGWDPSGEALYYFNPATATSQWIWSRPQLNNRKPYFLQMRTRLPLEKAGPSQFPACRCFHL